MSEKEKLVYVPMSADTIHPGHLNIIKVASELGRVMVGLFSDEAIATYKKVPVMDYEQRKLVVENIKGVDCVVKQDSRDYEPNLRKFKPDYMVHGTDWREGPLAAVRARAMEVMAEWGGSVVEPEYTRGVSSSALHEQMGRNGRTAEEKRGDLNRLLTVKDFISVVGVYDAQSAGIAGSEAVKTDDGVKRQIDALWLDVESMAGSKGLAEPESLEAGEYMERIMEIGLATDKPIMAPFVSRPASKSDRDKILLLRKMEQAGASAIAVSGNDAEGLRSAISFVREYRNSANLAVWAVLDVRGKKDVSVMLSECRDIGADGLICEYSEGLQILGETQGLGKTPVLARSAGDLPPGREQIRRAGFSGFLEMSAIGEAVERCVKDHVERILRAIV